MNGVIYARYSSDNQREESIEGQLRECKAFAEKNGIAVLSTYIDRALTAKSDNRPDFQRMIKDAGKEMFDVIIVWKLDRFARNRYDSAHYKGMLKKHGVKVISATEPITDDPTGILLESMLEGYAEFFFAELAEKVTRGMTENVLKGKYNGGMLPLGYSINVDGYFTVNELEAPVVVEIFRLYHSGLTLKEVAETMKERGLRSRRGKVIPPSSITKILRNRKYIGEYSFKSTVQAGVIPRIVPDDLFESVRKRLDGNAHAPARYKAHDERYLLSTKLFCGSCGAFMVGESGRSKSGKVFRYYKCATAKKHRSCGRKAMTKKMIEDFVVDFIKDTLMDDKLMDRVADMVFAAQTREQGELPLLRKRLAETEKAICNMLDAIQRGVFNELTKGRLDDLNGVKKELEIDIARAEIADTLLSREQILFWLCRFRTLNVSDENHRQTLVDVFINTVYIYDGKIVITLNWKDNADTVTLTDLSCSDLDALAVPKSPPFQRIAGFIFSPFI